MKRVWLALAFAALALQVAAAVHVPGLHEDVPASCGNDASHFCADSAARDLHVCQLCRLHAEGMDLLQGEAQVILVVTRSAPPRHRETGVSSPILAGASPRAPPAL